MSVPRQVWNSLSRSSVSSRLSIVLLAASLIGGVALRTVWLDQVPPGLHHDEACGAYDAYCILETGHDQHGNLLPIMIQGFNDYRPPLFHYCLVPLIWAFGLGPVTVRLCAALWGVADLFALTALAGLLLGLPGATATALFCALSPWHLSISRFGVYYIVAPATISLAVLSFFLWRNRNRDYYLLLSGAFFGLSLYSYQITFTFTPLMMALLVLMYRRDLIRARHTALAALGIFLFCATPLGVVFMLRPQEILAPVRRLSIFTYILTCPHCDPHLATAISTLAVALKMLAANGLAYFTPSYLFLTGDHGDAWLILHPAGFGELLPEQAPLILLGLSALLSRGRRKLAVLLIGWLVLATLPPATTVPPGSFPVDGESASGAPTAWILTSQHIPASPTLTPRMLLSHPSERRDVLAIAPWTLLSALGVIVLLELTGRAAVAALIAVGLLLAGSVAHGAVFLKHYFQDFPREAAPFFQYGMKEVVQAISKLDDGSEPIIITNQITMPYIYVLFFGHYPPALFQSQHIMYLPGVTPPPVSMHAPVLRFDRYLFIDPNRAFQHVHGHGIFVFVGNDVLPASPSMSVTYPDGTVAYNIVVK